MADQSRTDGAIKRKMITFLIGAQEFCVDARSVAVVLTWKPLIPLLHAPSFVCGMRQIGGAVLPIIDAAVRLGLPATKPTNRHIILVVEIAHQTAGLLVEGTKSKIVMISEDMTQLIPDDVPQTVKGLVSSIAAIDGRMISLISLPAIVPDSKKLFAA